MTFKFSAAVAAFAGLALAFSPVSFPAAAHDAKLGPLTIDHPWARATPGQARNGAVYLTIKTSAAEGDRLIRAESAVAAKVELHTHLHENGVMKMRPVTDIPVAPGKLTKLEPSGLHIMLLNLKAPLKVGDKFPLTLVFEKAGSTSVEVAVEAAGAAGHTH
jgi:copper(I)-binding protein